jgi:glycine hydroxymethyltransferase
MAQEISESGLRLVSGGTDNHLMLVDVTPLGITGQQADSALEKVGIIANKNAIPFDPKPPRVASGLRLGTPAITSRGFEEGAARQVARLIVEALTAVDDEGVHRRVAGEVKELAARFPVPGLDL